MAEERASSLHELAAEFERLKEQVTGHSTDPGMLRDAALAAKTYVNELAIAGRHEDVSPELDWLTALAVDRTDVAELAVIAATAMFDHINNLGVAERFDDALAAWVRLKAFVANYPEDREVCLCIDSASINLAGMIGFINESAGACYHWLSIRLAPEHSDAG